MIDRRVQTLMVGLLCASAWACSASSAGHTDAQPTASDAAATGDGAPAVDGSSPPVDGGPACDLRQYACRPFNDTYPAGGATQIDRQSNRKAAGSYCTRFATSSSEWQTSQDCSLTESCVATSSGASCQSCGADARITYARTVDGQSVNNCLGCGCLSSFAVYGCYSTPLVMGERWIDLVFQESYDVARFQVTESGRVFHNDAPLFTVTAVSVALATIQFQPQGLVEFDVTMDAQKTDSAGVVHPWHATSHVVRHCPN